MGISPECRDPISGRAVKNMPAAAVLGRLLVTAPALPNARGADGEPSLPPALVAGR